MQKLIDGLIKFKKGLFVYSDPGGAKPILALVSIIKTNYPTFNFSVISDREYDFSSEFCNVKIVDKLEQYLSEENDFNFIFSGTSYTSSIERKCLKWAKKNNMATYSFVDHWTNIASRFEMNDNYIYPDTIYVIDKKAKQNGINEGIPEERLEEIENPFHTYLKNWTPTTTRNEFFDSLGIVSLNKVVLTFAPDPVSNIDWKYKYNKDESNVLEQLLNALTSFNTDNYQLLIQPHPNQNIEIINTVLNDLKYGGVQCHLVSNVDVTSLLHHSDVVIGMFSNILLEASILGTEVGRVILENTPDLMEKEIGSILTTTNDCRSFLLNLID